MEVGTLSIVATPIGNLGDITLRALETLKNADAIACEDTRVSAKLLTRYEISKPLLIYNGVQARVQSARVLALLAEGKRVALVTDAGTPAISDPGTELVAAARALGARIEAIPGASALTAALSISGIDTSEFIFLGFLPHKKGRQTIFKQIAEEKRAVVFYESPHRIEKALVSLATVAPTRRILACRELTKIHEEVVEGTAEEVRAKLIAKGGVRGEFVVIIAPK